MQWRALLFEIRGTDLGRSYQLPGYEDSRMVKSPGSGSMQHELLDLFELTRLCRICAIIDIRSCGTWSLCTRAPCGAPSRLASFMNTARFQRAERVAHLQASLLV